MSAAPLVLVLGTADWDAAIATNQHHVAPALARRWPVLFAEGTGTRRLRVSDARRVLRRLRPPAPVPGRPVPAGLEVVSPRLVPHHAPSTRAVNGWALRRQVRRWVEHDGPRLLWTYTPFTYGLEALADRTVYHLVDLLHENPGVHRARLLAAERSLAAGTDLALATSPAVQEHLRERGFAATRCLPNVCDVDLFAAARGRGAPRSATVVFAGTLAPHKVDLPLLLDLATALRGRGRLRLIGPVTADCAGDPAWARLLAAGAEVVGPLPAGALADELAAATVGIVPYRVSPLTAGISPLKTFEYLAAGLPVVSTPLPAVAAVPGAVFVTARPEFTARVLDVLADPDPARPARVADLARGQDWTSRGRELRALAGALLAA
ncbi:glycosyltransferase [Kineococcus radiotolerans]|uniref:Glycosyl transferase, group 1 n=1 Tax=Kineococcus radiotolerans (strain ATCC BAA-149 / DSM 14245 / SRS30216) TaxID=266940 RepID=A6W3W7_KINRD|nr:glycosyltransferase [Kineococcus radiotolerans]ABS01506.1 glycosyl transferase, group 1 [Kineococcus radiotolerans SRS30216 = ATCC BAA-149]